MSRATAPTKKILKRNAKKIQLEDNLLELEIADTWTSAFTIRKPFYLTENHKSFIDSLMDPVTRIGFVDGPAGSAKSYLAILAGLELLQQKKIDSILYIRSVIESASKSMGALPGEIDEKFSPYAAPMMEKANEIVGESSAAMLKTKGILSAIPVNFVRGLTFKNSLVVVDEAQNLTRDELVTILTRCGKGSKYAVCGDLQQSDIGAKTGFDDVFYRFEKRQNKKFPTIKFQDRDIVRDKILREIVDILNL